MRCVICGSILPDGSALQCGLNECRAPLCPSAYGDECRSVHKKQVHPDADLAPATSVMGFVKGLKEKLRAAESRASIAEGHVIHWKTVNHATDVNAKQKFWALIKWLRAVDPQQFNAALEAGLLGKQDVLE